MSKRPATEKGRPSRPVEIPHEEMTLNYNAKTCAHLHIGTVPLHQAGYHIRSDEGAESPFPPIWADVWVFDRTGEPVKIPLFVTTGQTSYYELMLVKEFQDGRGPDPRDIDMVDQYEGYPHGFTEGNEECEDEDPDFDMTETEINEELNKIHDPPLNAFSSTSVDYQSAFADKIGEVPPQKMGVAVYNHIGDMDAYYAAMEVYDAAKKRQRDGG